MKDVEEEACMLFSQGRLRKKKQHIIGYPICQFACLPIYGKTLTGSNFFLQISFEPDALPIQNKVR